MVSREHPVDISKYIEAVKEVELDSVVANRVLSNYAIAEHVEMQVCTAAMRLCYT